MWKLWDDFGIVDSKMVGFWRKINSYFRSKKCLCYYLFKDGKALIAIESWLNEPVNVKMNTDTFEFKAGEVNIKAPEIKNYQKERSFKVETNPNRSK